MSMLDFKNFGLEASLSLDITDYAQQIELDCADILLPPPKGIYMKNRLEPVMVDGQSYYERAGTQVTPVTDVNVAVKNIYDENNRLIIPKTFLLQREKYLSNYPFIPYRGSKLIELLTNETIDDFVQHRRAYGYTQRIAAHFNSDAFFEVEEVLVNGRTHTSPLAGREEQIRDLLSKAYSGLQSEVNAFVDDHSWNLFLVQLVNSKLIIERYCDYRIYAWEQEHGESFRKNLR